MTPYYSHAGIEFYQGKCEEVMAHIPGGSIDAIICDLSYGTTACKWDMVIPFDVLWTHYKRIIKRNGAIVLFGSQPFTTALIASNMAWFKYCWVWDKVSKGDVMNAKNKPLKQHEDICVFSEGTTANGSVRKMPYYPQGVGPNLRTANNQNRHEGAFKGLRPSMAASYMRQGSNYPSSIIQFSNADHTQGLHPTQKPVALLEYLVKTYTNEGERVFDNTMGSGTTGVACVRLGRKFIGIEQDKDYCEIAQRRIEHELSQPQLFSAEPEPTPEPQTLSLLEAIS